MVLILILDLPVYIFGIVLLIFIVYNLLALVILIYLCFLKSILKPIFTKRIIVDFIINFNMNT